MERIRESQSGSFGLIISVLTMMLFVSFSSSYSQIVINQTGYYFQGFNPPATNGSANGCHLFITTVSPWQNPPLVHPMFLKPLKSSFEAKSFKNGDHVQDLFNWKAQPITRYLLLKTNILNEKLKPSKAALIPLKTVTLPPKEIVLPSSHKVWHPEEEDASFLGGLIREILMTQPGNHPQK